MRKMNKNNYKIVNHKNQNLKKQKCEEPKKENKEKNEENEKETLTKHDFMNNADNIEVECLKEKNYLKTKM